MADKEITLDYAIELMEIQRGEVGLVTGVWLYCDDVVEYLKDYRDLLQQLKNRSGE